MRCCKFHFIIREWLYVVSVSLNDEIEHKLQERQQEIKFCDQ